jgi:gamma-glutamylputrescine oxidase
MYSFWERGDLQEHDIAIIGGGLVGMSVAASIKERWPERSVTVFERSVIPYGASTRNAGFACTGSLSELASDIDLMGHDSVRELVFQRWLGLKITLNRIERTQYDYFNHGGFEIIRSDELEVLNRLQEVNEMVEDFLPEYITVHDDAGEFGISLGDNEKLLHIRSEGQLHPGKLVKSLERYCTELGVSFRVGCKIESISKSDSKYKLMVNDLSRGLITMTCNRPIICTNAYTRELYDDINIVPGRGQVLITQPIPDLNFRGNLHIDRGFYYLRNVNQRLLIGGGRNEDFEAEETDIMELNMSIQSSLERILQKSIGLNSPLQIHSRWAGIMAFGESKLPVVRLEPDGLLTAVKLSGMGVALAGFVGEAVADLIENNQL